MRMYHFQAQNGPFVLNKFFLVETIIIVQNLKKILTADPELWGCTILGPKMVHLPKTIFFFWKIINIILIYLLAPFIVQNFRNILPAVQSYEHAQFLGLKWPTSPNENFFQKTC